MFITIAGAVGGKPWLDDNNSPMQGFFKANAARLR
jgi:hypothetical protein